MPKRPEGETSQLSSRLHKLDDISNTPSVKENYATARRNFARIPSQNDWSWWLMDLNFTRIISNSGKILFKIFFLFFPLSIVGCFRPSKIMFCNKLFKFQNFLIIIRYLKKVLPRARYFSPSSILRLKCKRMRLAVIFFHAWSLWSIVDCCQGALNIGIGAEDSLIGLASVHFILTRKSKWKFATTIVSTTYLI